MSVTVSLDLVTSYKDDKMGNELHEMTEDLKTRIRDLAYLMWESAGRQQGMAMEYWLKAEREVLSTLQAAARILPGGATQESTEAASANTPALAIASRPAAASAPEAAQPARGAPSAESQAAGRPAAKKVASRTRAKT